MKRFSILIICTLMALTGCASIDSSETNLVTREFKGTELANDPILQQVNELTQKQVLKNVEIRESFPVQIKATGPENILSCLSRPDGRWVEEQQECEQMSEQSCSSLGGQFNECASACRNQPEAGMCIQMCVPVCSFSK